MLDVVYYAFIVVVIIQAIFYIFFFGRFALLKPQNKAFKTVAVSVIICAKNEAENLKRFLPFVISQAYPRFEIVLVNDGSKDETLTIMKAFAHAHPNIQVVNSKANKTFNSSKKQALTLGIEASKHDYLLFTDADCQPVSKYWIANMCAQFTHEQQIILGYGKYIAIKNAFVNKLIRFETLMTAIQYFSYAQIGIPYMGVGRNIAYTKKMFLKANGFNSHLKIKSGDDDLFVNNIANSKNTAICFSKESFTTSVPKTTLKSWMRQKRRHISTAQYYKLEHKILLSVFYLSNLFFWIFAIVLFLNTYNWVVVLTLFLLRLGIQCSILNLASKKLDETHLLTWSPILDFFLIGAQLTIFINNLISKPNFWK